MTALSINPTTITFTQIETAFKDTANLDTGIRLKGNELSNQSHSFLPERGAKAEAKHLLLKAIENEYGPDVANALKQTNMFHENDSFKIFKGEFADNSKLTAKDLKSIRQFIESQSRHNAQDHFIGSKENLPKQGVDVLNNGGKVSTTMAGGGGILFVHNGQNEKVGVIKPVENEEVQQTLQLQRFYEGILENGNQDLPFGFLTVKHINDKEDVQTVVEHIKTEKERVANDTDKGPHERLDGFQTSIENGGQELMQMEFVEGKTLREIELKTTEDLHQVNLAMRKLGKTAPFCALFGLKDHTLGGPGKFNLENMIITDGQFKVMDPDVGSKKPGFEAKELQNLFQEMADLASAGPELYDKLLQLFVGRQDITCGSIFNGIKQEHEFAIVTALRQELSDRNIDIGRINNDEKAKLMTNFVIGMYEGMREMAANSTGIAKALTEFNATAGEYALHRNDEGGPITGDQFMEIFKGVFDKIDHQQASSIRGEKPN